MVPNFNPNKWDEEKIIDYVIGEQPLTDEQLEFLIYFDKLQQENVDLKQMVNFPSITIATCPKCGERYSINYCREVYELEEKVKNLEETLKGTTHCFDEEEHNKLIRENEYLKETLENNSKINVADHKYSSEMEDKYLTEHYILTEFEKWLEEYIENEKYCYLSSEEEDKYRYDIFQECLNKLQELKEGNKQ